MQNLNTVPSNGTYGAAIALINQNFTLVKEQLEHLLYMREGFCGMYETSAALSAAHPNPVAGSFAYVGSAFPMAVYMVSNGSWYATQETYDGGDIDLTQYATSSALTALAGRVTALEGAGYQFAGVASPAASINLNGNTSKIFFLAFAPGTYTNYGGLTLSDGEIGVLYFNGSTWSGSKATDIMAKGIVGGYDETPTEDSEKLVTSGGVFDALSGLRQEFNEELSEVNPQFATGEEVGDVSIVSKPGSGTSAIMTQAAVSGTVFNEIDIDDIDDIIFNGGQLTPNPAFAGSESGVPAYYTVYDGTLHKLKVGVMSVISDNMGHVVTQMMATHYVLDDSGQITGAHSDSDLFLIYRSAKLSGGTLPTVVGEWTPWNYVNNSILANAVASIRTDLLGYYLKTETYSKEQVNALIDAINQFEYAVVAQLPMASSSTRHKIYLVPSTNPETSNVKDEFITITTTQNGVIRYSWEQIGSTTVDLSGYSTTAQMNAAISSAVAAEAALRNLLDGRVTALEEASASLQESIDGEVIAREAAVAAETAAREAAVAEVDKELGDGMYNLFKSLACKFPIVYGGNNSIYARCLFKAGKTYSIIVRGIDAEGSTANSNCVLGNVFLSTATQGGVKIQDLDDIVIKDGVSKVVSFTVTGDVDALCFHIFSRSTAAFNGELYVIESGLLYDTNPIEISVTSNTRSQWIPFGFVEGVDYLIQIDTNADVTLNLVFTSENRTAEGVVDTLSNTSIQSGKPYVTTFKATGNAAFLHFYQNVPSTGVNYTIKIAAISTIDQLKASIGALDEDIDAISGDIDELKDTIEELNEELFDIETQSEETSATGVSGDNSIYVPITFKKGSLCKVSITADGTGPDTEYVYPTTFGLMNVYSCDSNRNKIDYIGISEGVSYPGRVYVVDGKFEFEFVPGGDAVYLHYATNAKVAFTVTVETITEKSKAAIDALGEEVDELYDEDHKTELLVENDVSSANSRWIECYFEKGYDYEVTIVSPSAVNLGIIYLTTTKTGVATHPWYIVQNLPNISVQAGVPYVLKFKATAFAKYFHYYTANSPEIAVSIRVTRTLEKSHWRGKKVVWLGTSIPFGSAADAAYPYIAAKKLGFNLVQTSVPGMSIVAEESDGVLYPYKFGSSCLSVAEYLNAIAEGKASQNMKPSDALPDGYYVPGGVYNKYYWTWEHIITQENADADLWVLDVVGNNAGKYSLSDWNAFYPSEWRYTDGSSFADHRTTFIGALLFLMDKIYSLNSKARIAFLLSTSIDYANGKSAFETLSALWNIPIIDIWKTFDIVSPITRLYVKTQDGADPNREKEVDYTNAIDVTTVKEALTFALYHGEEVVDIKTIPVIYPNVAAKSWSAGLSVVTDLTNKVGSLVCDYEGKVQGINGNDKYVFETYLSQTVWEKENTSSSSSPVVSKNINFDGYTRNVQCKVGNTYIDADYGTGIKRFFKFAVSDETEVVGGLSITREKLTITVKEGVVLKYPIALTIVVRVYEDGVEKKAYSTYFLLNPIRPAVEGGDVDVYQLNPSTDKLIYSQGYTPGNPVSCTATKKVNGTGEAVSPEEHTCVITYSNNVIVTASTNSKHLLGSGVHPTTYGQEMLGLALTEEMKEVS